MAAFEYQALNVAGKEVRGILQADTARAARSQLRDQGLTPLALGAINEKSLAQKQPFSKKPRLNDKYLALFAQQLAALLKAGLPMDDALAALTDQNADKAGKAIIAQLRSRVMEGQALAAAMAEFPESFAETFRASVAAGEASSQLGPVLLKLAEFIEKKEEFSRQIWMALAYPVFLCAIALLIVAGLMVYVVPQVISVFEHLNQQLPWITRLLIAVSTWFKAYGLVFIGALAGLLVGFKVSLRQSAIRSKWHGLLLQAPGIGHLIKTLDTIRATRTMATLVLSGVTIIEAMNLAAMALQNLQIRAGFRKAMARVREGTGFAKALGEQRHFPAVTVRLIASGEKSGDLGNMLDQAAHYQEKDLQGILAAITALLGPSVILVVGGLILFIVLAILLPIFDLNQLIH